MLETKRVRKSAAHRGREILAAAEKLFTERGFAATSIDAIVERAGGSKATVYAQFGSKEGILEAIVASASEDLSAAFNAIPYDAPIETALRALGRAILNFILAPDHVALYRVVAGESGQRPDLGDIFYRSCPQVGMRLVTDYLREAAARGSIEAPDPEKLASFFIGALRGDFHLRALFNSTRILTAREIDQHLDFVVPTFLKACRREERPSD